MLGVARRSPPKPSKELGFMAAPAKKGDWRLTEDGRVYRFGRKRYPNRDLYEGEFLDGVREGKFLKLRRCLCSQVSLTPNHATIPYLETPSNR